MKKIGIKLLKSGLCFCLTTVLLSVSVKQESKAITFTDIENHWARESILFWAESDVVSGYEGKFNPKSSIKRCDLAVILDKIMGYQIPAYNSFNDMMEERYYTNAMLRAYEAGIIRGSGFALRPKDEVTREEAAVILATALHIPVTTVVNTGFDDDADISSWAKGAVLALKNAGLISGKSGNVFAPEDEITRAEICGILSQGISAFIYQGGSYYESTSGTMVINKPQVYLDGAVIGGNLILAEGISLGEVRLSNVTVRGDIIIKGGGTNSIYLSNVTVNGSIIVDKNTGPVRVVISGNSNIPKITVENNATIQASNLNTIGRVGEVVLLGGTEHTVEGSLQTVTNQVNDVKVTIGTGVQHFVNYGQNAEIIGKGEVDRITNCASDTSITINNTVDYFVNQGDSAKIILNGTIPSLFNTGDYLILEVTLGSRITSIDNSGKFVQVLSSGYIAKFKTTTVLVFNNTFFDAVHSY